MKTDMKKLFSFLGPKKDVKQTIQEGDECRDAGQLDQAERSFTKALEMAEAAKDHNATGIALFKLGQLAELQHRTPLAESYYNKCYRCHEDSEEWEAAADCLMRLGVIYYTQRRIRDATQLFGVAQKHYQSENNEHPALSESSAWLAECCMEQRQYGMAEKHIRASISYAEQKLSAEHPSIAPRWAKLGVACLRQDKGKEKDSEAEAAFQRALAIFEQFSTTGDNIASADGGTATNEYMIDFCSCLHQYGRLLAKNNNPLSAKERLQKAVQISEKYPGYLEEAELVTEIANLG